MKKVIERIVESPGAPNENDLWLNGKTLKKFQNGEWVAISGGNSGGGSDSDSGSDIQIVELTYEHLPATGTLSASDLAKLDSDNCLLVMNGKYFRKTFSSNGGIDYKEIGLTTVLGGVRSIYFTTSKPDGEYTIAYTYPVEANTQTEATTALENIKVGNTTYSVPLAPMLVEGTVDHADDGGVFSPNVGMPSFSEARAHMLDGGQVYMIVDVGFETLVNVACATSAQYIAGFDFNWRNPGSEGGDDEPQTYTIKGTVNSNKEFVENNGQMAYPDAYLHYNNGDTIILQFTSLATGVTMNETVVSWDDGATTTNGFTWSAVM